MTTTTTETDRVRRLVEPLAAQAEVALVDVALKGSGPRRLLRVVVDRKGGVDLATCQRLARELSEALDGEDPVEGRYSLEVTSPGTDHPLTDQASFDRVEGRAVLIHRQQGDGPPEQVRGTVVKAGEAGVVLDADGDTVSIPYDQITKAKQALPW